MPIPLTERERELVQSTWALATKDMYAAGIALFIRFFKENRDFLEIFRFGNVNDVEELKERPRLKAHARNVTNTLDLIVKNLDEPEIVNEMIANLVESHKRRNLGAYQFERLKITLVGLLKDVLGEEVMTNEAVAAWASFYESFTQAL